MVLGNDAITNDYDENCVAVDTGDIIAEAMDDVTGGVLDVFVEAVTYFTPSPELQLTQQVNMPAGMQISVQSKLDQCQNYIL